MSALHLTPQQMMERWRRLAFPDAVNADCTVTRYDGIDLEGHLMERMRSWYVDLIHNAPPELLAPVDIAGEISISPLADGSAWFTLPEKVVRLMSLRLYGWDAPALIIPDASLPGASLQLSGRQRSGSSAPVAVVDGRTVRVFSPASGVPLRPEVCTAVVDTPDLYHLDERALSTIRLLF